MSIIGDFDDLPRSDNEINYEKQQLPSLLHQTSAGKSRQFKIGASSGSDSDIETEILEEAEDLEYGTTPPRHIRRMKSKTKSSVMRVNNQL